MKHSIFYSIAAATAAISIAACTGGSDVAGIGGSGVTSTGTITGFGSIFVNGVEFETSSSTFNVDDNPDSTEDDLAIGMRVTVHGTLNDDGITGTAASVTYDDELQGPVSSITTPNPGDVSRIAKIFGIEVTLNSTTTQFDIDDSPPGNFSFNTIKEGDNVEISGFFDSSGTLVATRVELKDKAFKINESIVELRGTISGLIGTDFKLNLRGMAGASVDVDASGDISYEHLPPEGLTDGTFVEVRGTCPEITCTTIKAKRIEGESEGFDDSYGDGDVEIEGFITRYVDDSDFDVDGLRVDASSAEKDPSSLDLAIDMLVEVHGTVVNNVLVASRVELEH